MSGATTTITNPDDLDDVRKFNFDYSYWSHDGATEENNGYFSPKPDTSYIGQVRINIVFLFTTMNLGGFF